MKKRLTAAVMAAMTLLPLNMMGEAKYVFYFIGDGMGMGHVNATEAYNRDILKAEAPLLMMQFPVAAQVRTYSASDPVTDSAASGTALSTGHKTNNGMVGMDADTTVVYSISRKLMEAGYAVGVATTVYGDDATPSAFYAHAQNRKMYPEISGQAVNSGLTFLGAAMFQGMYDKEGNPTSWLNDMKKGGYTLMEGFSATENLKKWPEKMLMISSKPYGTQAGYTLDSIPGANTLTQLTQACLGQLQHSGKDKFFMMVEAGNIDWGGHANDGATVIKEILNFQEAIDVAYKFYLEHPEETLIVITADHDTGGMALGRKDGKKIQLGLADFQKISKDRFADYWRDRLNNNDIPTWEEMKTFLQENLGFWGAIQLSDKDKERIKKSFKHTFVSREDKGEKTLYNDFNEFTVTVYDVVNRHLGIGWTTSRHTGNFVPLYAIGAGSELFTTNLNNTQVPMTILKAALGCSGRCDGNHDTCSHKK